MFALFFCRFSPPPPRARFADRPNYLPVDSERNHAAWKGGNSNSGRGEAKQAVDNTESLQRLVHRAEHTLSALVDASLRPEATALLAREDDGGFCLPLPFTRITLTI